MYIKTDNQWWTSSADPAQLSLTIKGWLMFSVPILLAIGQNYFPTLNQSDVVNFIGYISTIISCGVMLIGFIRKIYFWFKNKNVIM